MNHKQIFAIRCAFADLIGALEAHQQMDRLAHHWDGHRESIDDLIDAFPELNLEAPPSVLSCDHE